MTGGFTFASLTLAWAHTCGVTSAGAAYCWGRNDQGQLGADPATAPQACEGSTLLPCSEVPLAVAGGLTFASLAAGIDFTCGLTSGGAAYCWGFNGYGELGDGSTTNRTTPVAVAGGLTFASLTANDWGTCGLTSGGAAYCWGHGRYGQLGNGSEDDRYAPVAVSGGHTFASLTARGGHTCGVTIDGAAYCWGYNQKGQLGDGSTDHSLTPVAVTNP